MGEYNELKSRIKLLSRQNSELIIECSQLKSRNRYLCAQAANLSDLKSQCYSLVNENRMLHKDKDNFIRKVTGFLPGLTSQVPEGSTGPGIAYVYSDINQLSTEGQFLLENFEMSQWRTTGLSRMEGEGISSPGNK